MKKIWKSAVFCVECFRTWYWSSRKIERLPLAWSFGQALGETISRTVWYWKGDWRRLWYGNEKSS